MATSKRTIDSPDPIKTLQSLTDLFTEAVFLLDRSDRVILANHAAQTMTALPETALVAQPIESILSLNVPKRTKSKIANPQTETLLQVPATVHGHSHSATFVPLPNLTYFPKLKPRPYALVIVTPTTSRIHDHTTATIYLQIVGQLTMRIAHDLNNSLTSIIGNAELIKEQLAHDFPELDDVIRKSHEMAQFINRLQQYARQQPLTKHSLDLNTAIHDFLPIAKSLLGPTIQITFLPADELPRIYIDRPRIDQVLLSILLSCKKEMSTGGRITIETDHVDLDVEFTSTHPGARPGTYSRLSITDSSNGMDSKRVARIFDFPTAHVLDSSILGLPIAYSIVKDLKGYITLESWIRKGTRFDIYIPLSVSTAPTPLLDAFSLPDSHNPSSTNSSLILVADDDPDIQNTIARCVSRVGYKTLFASDGRTALDLYEQLTGEDNQPALLIADLGLPTIDGGALSLTIQERYQNACVLLTSGHEIDINPTTGLTPEGFTFLHKPFEPNALLTTIERLLKREGPQHSLKRATSSSNARKHKKPNPA
jgi:signal transduction histidine kinase/FixJ family two-component response regulator